MQLTRPHQAVMDYRHRRYDRLWPLLWRSSRPAKLEGSWERNPHGRKSTPGTRNGEHIAHRVIVFILAVLAASSAGVAQVPYSVTDLCAPAICVQGPPGCESSRFERQRSGRRELPAAAHSCSTRGKEMINVNQQTGLAGLSYALSGSITRECIAGVRVHPGCSPAACTPCYTFPGGLLLDLNPVFGWHRRRRLDTSPTRTSSRASGQNAVGGDFSPLPGAEFRSGHRVRHSAQDYRHRDRGRRESH